MDLHGKNFIAASLSAAGPANLSARNPATGEVLPGTFHEATAEEISHAAEAAAGAFRAFSLETPEKRALLLEGIIEAILDLGDTLIHRATTETALPEARLVGERTRTVNQLRMFAELLREGSWVEATIDRAVPNRKPLAKPDLRRVLIPIGPVGIFGASNFPLAFSVPGGDTASALAAGCPVVVKAHPAHPGTSELVAGAMVRALQKLQMAPGIFSMVHGATPRTGLLLATHPALRAIAFTGSLRAGRALFDAAAARPEPIPVFAEMGSTNPIFVLPGALAQNGSAFATGLINSVTLGVGQFCTNPGLVFGLQGEPWRLMVKSASECAMGAAPGTMLTAGIQERFQAGAEKARATPGVSLAGQANAECKAGQAKATVFLTDAAAFLATPDLHEEIFGPATLLVECSDPLQFEQIASQLPGQLTATIHGTVEDLRTHQNLVAILREKAGRLIFNSFPTGVEVCPSMQHGGPWPATTFAHFTSVGTAAIKRFVRPICFQDFPQWALPLELQDANPRGVRRLVDGKWES